ncbi:MAG TPA: hypothetical protein VEQ59_10795 [Polyangiaceae bacterium]|nr:hypothetical protein [Polyangiaceae bacterium]
MALACASLLWASGEAWAEDAAAPASAEKSATDPSIARAATAAAYTRALALYEAGDLSGALLQMRECHRLSQKPEVLYNIARIQGELHDCAGSLASYRQYLEQAPQGRYRDAAGQAVKELAATCGERKPDPKLEQAALVDVPPPVSAARSEQRAPSPPPPPDDAARAPRLAPWAGWAAIGAGVAAGAGAVYLTTRAVAARDRYQDNIEVAYATDGPLDHGPEREQHRNQRWALGLGIGGGALVAGGVLWLLLAPREGAPPRPVASLGLQPGLITASLKLSF